MLYMNFLQTVKRQASPLSYLKGVFFKKTIMVREEIILTFSIRNKKYIYWLAQIAQTRYWPNLSTRPYTAWLYGVSNHTSTIFSPSWRINFRKDWKVNNIHILDSCWSNPITFPSLQKLLLMNCTLIINISKHQTHYSPLMSSSFHHFLVKHI